MLRKRMLTTVAIQRTLAKARTKFDLKIRHRDRLHPAKLAKYVAERAASNAVAPWAGSDTTIAIVIPCYGHARFVPRALESIAHQTVQPNQIIAIDDHSPDSTYQVLQDSALSLGLDATKVTTGRNPANLGQCATLNRAIGHAKTDLIMILNDDDYLMHDAVERAIEVFRAFPHIALLGTQAVYVYGEGYLDNHKKRVADALITGQLEIGVRYPADVLKYRTARDLDMCHSGSTFRKQAWAAVGGYWPRKGDRLVLFSDRDFQLRVNALFPVAIVRNAAFAFWRIDSSVDEGLFT